VDFPASYGGVEITDDRDIVVYVAGKDPALVYGAGRLVVQSRTMQAPVAIS
jgi:hypothetical protein